MNTEKLTLILLALCCAMSVSTVRAQTASSGPLDVMVVLDNSGSMKKNDPGALMGKAVSAFAGDLPADSRMGIVIFDQGVRPALALTAGGTAKFEAQVAQGLRGINYRGQWTDIPGGVERALYELREQGRPQAQRALILFTDGVVETGNAATDMERSRWLQESLAAEAKQLGIRIFGIAFTEGADFRLLQSVAQSTGGEHYRVVAAADIAGVFERVRSRIQELADEEVRKAAEAKARAAEVIRPTAPAPPAAGVPWGWMLGLALAGGAIVLVVWVIRSRPAATGSLRDVGGHTGQELHPLRRKLTRVGRDAKTNDLVVPQDTMSSQHAQIEIRGTTFYLRDLRSGNGSFVNGKKISDVDSIRESALKHGDRLRFDAFEFEFAIDGFAKGPASASGAPVTPGGTRLRAVGAETPASPVLAVAPNAPTRLKTGKCNVHTAWDAIGVCSRCGYEKCKQCMTKRAGTDICIDCATAPGYETA